MTRLSGGTIETATIWYLLIGLLLVSMSLMGTVLERLPLSPAMLYLAAGFMLGPSGVGLVRIDPIENAPLLTVATEVALLISLFAVGLRLRVELSDRMWWLPVRLGVVGMLVTIALLAAAGYFLLGMSVGAAMLLAAILSPTDPVLASDVQVRDPGDRDRARFSLSGEGGLNDGTTYPFAMLGLFLLGVPDAASFGSALGVLQAVWGVACGLASGWVMGRLIVNLALYLRRRHQQALGLEEFLALGLIALSYGVAHLLHGVGFLAVFAAGVAMRGAEHKASGQTAPAQILGAVQVGNEGEVATDPEKGPAYMAETILGFNEQLEHIVEFVMVLVLGIMLSASGISLEGLALSGLLLVVIRPIASGVALAGATSTRLQRWLMAWFGIRGIGSLYYLAFALQYRLDSATVQRIVPLVLTVLAASIMVHGISATPIMEKYYRVPRG